MHPGHTPYMNIDDWDAGMVMGKPSWLCEKGYPANFGETWPRAEAYFNTRYVWAHSEFTPQQTMRGKTALYGYLYGIGTRHSGTVRRAQGNRPGLQPRLIRLTVGGSVLGVPEGKDCAIKILDLAGRVVWAGEQSLTKHARLPVSISGRSGVLLCEIRYGDGRNVRMASFHLK